MFEKMFYILFVKLQNERMSISDKRFKFKMPIKILDSTTIGLCLSLFDWAKFRTTKGGIRLHVMYNSKEQIPGFMIFSNAKQHDIKAAHNMPIKKDSIYVMDKDYFCYKFFEMINKNARSGSNLPLKILLKY